MIVFPASHRGCQIAVIERRVFHGTNEILEQRRWFDFSRRSIVVAVTTTLSRWVLLAVPTMTQCVRRPILRNRLSFSISLSNAFLIIAPPYPDRSDPETRKDSRNIGVDLPDAGRNFDIWGSITVFQSENILVDLQLLQKVVLDTLFGHVELDNAFHSHIFKRVNNVVIAVLIGNALQGLAIKVAFRTNTEITNTRSSTTQPPDCRCAFVASHNRGGQTRRL